MILLLNGLGFEAPVLGLSLSLGLETLSLGLVLDLGLGHPRQSATSIICVHFTVYHVGLQSSVLTVEF